MPTDDNRGDDGDQVPGEETTNGDHSPIDVPGDGGWDTEQVRETLAALADDDPEGPTFDAPWQARAFAIAVALTEREDRDWTDFQSRLVERIDAADPERLSRDVEGTYYEEWLASLEEFLFDTGAITEAELDRRQAEFEAGDRDESEFVVRDGVEGR